MLRTAVFQFLVILLALVMVDVANGQGTSSNCNRNAGGATNTNCGVRTGHGPLTQPIPPAVSTINSQNNQNPQGIQRSQNLPGPAQTNLPQQPFGTR